MAYLGTGPTRSQIIADLLRQGAIQRHKPKQQIYSTAEGLSQLADAMLRGRINRVAADEEMGRRQAEVESWRNALAPQRGTITQGFQPNDLASALADRKPIWYGGDEEREFAPSVAGNFNVAAAPVDISQVGGPAIQAGGRRQTTMQDVARALLGNPDTAQAGQNIFLQDMQFQQQQQAAMEAARQQRVIERVVTGDEAVRLGGKPTDRLMVQQDALGRVVGIQEMRAPQQPETERFSVFNSQGQAVTPGTPGVPSTVLKDDIGTINRLESQGFTVGQLQRTSEAGSEGASKLDELQNAEYSILNAYDTGRRLLSLDDGAFQISGDFARIGSAIGAEWRSVAKLAGLADGETMGSLSDAARYADTFEALGIQSGLARANMLQLALSFASARGLGENRALSDRDVRNALETVGGAGMATPNGRKALIIDTLVSLEQGYRNKHRVLNPNTPFAGDFGLSEIVGAPVVHSDEDWARLPSGSTYFDAETRQYKQKG